MRRPILCVYSDIDKLAEALRSKCSHLCKKVTFADPKAGRSAATPLLEEAEVIVSEPHYVNAWLTGLPNRRLVHGTWAGADSIMDAVRREKITPTFTYCRIAGRYGIPISEYVLSYIIAQERKAKMVYEAQRNSTWSDEMQSYIWFNSRRLHSLSIGILGLGDIGREVARLCKAAGMKVWGFVNTVPPDDKRCPHVDVYRTSSELDTILSSCDYICNILPSTPQTRSLLDNERLKACESKQAVFINVGRGDICTEQSILHALQQGWLRSAILDVLPTEPLPSTSPLWQHPNVTITPHVAAVSTQDEISTLITENLENYINDRPLLHAVDWNKGY